MPKKEIVTVTEVVCQQLKHENCQPDEEAASEFRNKRVGILHNSKPPKSNITNQKDRPSNPSEKIKTSPYYRQIRGKWW